MPLPFPLLSDPYIDAALAGLALLTATTFLMKRRRTMVPQLSGVRRHWRTYVRRKSLLTPNEIEFFRRLRRALPGYAIFPQVAFSALLTDDGGKRGRDRFLLRARFDKKVADFVICDWRTLKVVALIELDDRTHNMNNDRQRDALTRAAGYQTFRFSSRSKPSEAEIAELFRHASAWQAT